MANEVKNAYEVERGRKKPLDNRSAKTGPDGFEQAQSRGFAAGEGNPPGEAFTIGAKGGKSSEKKEKGGKSEGGYGGV